MNSLFSVNFVVIYNIKIGMFQFGVKLLGVRFYTIWEKSINRIEFRLSVVSTAMHFDADRKLAKDSDLDSFTVVRSFGSLLHVLDAPARGCIAVGGASEGQLQR